jgi:hypothetical protein
MHPVRENKNKKTYEDVNETALEETALNPMAESKIKPTKTDKKPETSSKTKNANVHDDEKTGSHYKDYAAIPVSGSSGLCKSSDSTVPKRYRKLTEKLNSMLSTPDFEDIISWMPHGRSWKIHDTDDFVRNVLPK